MTTARIRYFDIAKGIGILCVVLGHAAIESTFIVPSRTAQDLIAFCFSFHMPLFFILAGYFMRPEGDFRWQRECRQLVFTYMLTGCCVVVGAGALAGLRHTADVWDTMWFWARTVWYGSGDVSDKTIWFVEGRIGAIWFLLAMFWARLFLHVFARLPYTGCWVAACFGTGYELSRHIWLPWSLQSGMCAVAFLYVGYLARQHDVLALLKHKPWIWAVFAALWALAFHYFSGFSMAMNDYGRYGVLAVLGALCGTACVVGISMLLERVPLASPALAWAGQASLAILCVHLVEDDVLPWGGILRLISDHLPAHVPLVAAAFPVHLLIDLPGAWLLGCIPVINTWFYPTIAARRAARTEVQG